MRTVTLLAVVWGCSPGAAAIAQTPAAAPNHAAPQAATARFVASLYGAYGNPQLSQSPGAAKTVTEAGADSDLFVRRQGQRIDLQLAAATGMRRFAVVDHASVWSHVTTASLVAPLTDRTHVGLTAMGGYSELLSLDGRLQQGSVASTAADQAQALDSGIGRRPTALFGGGAQVTRTLSTRSSVLLTYAARGSRVVEGARARTIDQHGLLALANRFHQRALLRVAYGFRQAEFGSPGAPWQVVRQHSAIIGFDRQWIHSPTRQSALRVSAGPSLFVGAGPSRYIATGDASLDTQFGQTWLLSFGASRAMSFVDGIPRPFLADSFRGEVRGRLGRRFDFGVAGSSSTGAGRFVADPASYRSHGARARVGVELSRTFALFGEYGHHWYELTGVLPADTPALTDTSRGNMRVGLTWQLPLKGRLPADAAR